MTGSRGRFLSDNILEFSILPRLSVKSLIRFKCVSKRWCSQISDSQFFILQHYQNCKSLCSLNFVGFDRFNGWQMHKSGSILRDPSSLCFRDFLPNLKVCQIMDSCNGLIAMRCELLLIPSSFYWQWKSTFELFVGNPVYQDWKWIPNPTDSVSSWTGLVFDPVDSVACYQLVSPYLLGRYHTSSNQLFEEYRFNVFSSETGNWVSKSETAVPVLDIWRGNSASLAHPACLRGALYWLVENHYVLWYDTKKDCSGLMPTPMVTDKIRGDSSLNESNGKITCTRVANLDIEVWSMKDFKWFKSYNIRIEEIVQRKPETFGHHINLRNDDRGTSTVIPIATEGKVVFFLMYMIPYSYDAGTGEATRYPSLSFMRCRSLLYKASLIPTPGCPGEQKLFRPGCPGEQKLIRQQWQHLQPKLEGYVCYKCTDGVLNISTRTAGDCEL